MNFKLAGITFIDFDKIEAIYIDTLPGDPEEPGYRACAKIGDQNTYTIVQGTEEEVTSYLSRQFNLDPNDVEDLFVRYGASNLIAKNYVPIKANFQEARVIDIKDSQAAKDAIKAGKEFLRKYSN